MGQLIEAGDTRLFVEERGRGPAIIVLHGGPGADHTQLLSSLEPLADEYRVVFVDQRAQGRSDAAPEDTWTIRHAAADVSALARALSLDSYAVLGHSYGALVALRHAVDHPGAAAATVVSHGVPSRRWYRLEEELAALEPAHVREQVEAAWSELDTVQSPARARELLVQQSAFHFNDPLDPRIAEMNEAILGQMIVTPTVNQVMSKSGLGGFDVQDALPEISQPLLVLTGRGERTCPLEASEYMARRTPGDELHVFEDSAHCSYVEENKSYLRVVRAFLRRTLA
jgi:proline iminopeptidase